MTTLYAKAVFWGNLRRVIGVVMAEDESGGGFRMELSPPTRPTADAGPRHDAVR